MKRVVVLGCGRVGATIVRDLAADERLGVTAVDFHPSNLRAVGDVCRNVRAIESDLSSAAQLRKVIVDADVVIGAMPSALGFVALRTIVEAGKRYCDISFMPEDALGLNDLARKSGATAVVDCGVAPGLANMLIGRAVADLDETEDVVFYVGGLPRTRHWPYQYRAPFAPLDVIEEYTRPARLIESGRIVTRPALSDAELINFKDVGTLEAFNTDGLRSLLATVPAKNMREKTLRFPGHIELMRVLRETGYFSKEPIEVGGVPVRPIDVTAKLLFPHWKAPKGELEFTILRVLVRGRKAGAVVERRFDMYDETDRNSGESSMARTTGFPAAIVARMLAFDEFSETGVFAPEQLAARPGVLERVLAELERRGVHVHESPCHSDAPPGPLRAI